MFNVSLEIQPWNCTDRIQKEKKKSMEMNCNRDGNRTLEEAFREEQALEGPENPERICWMDLEEVGKGRRSIVGVDGWVSNWDPGH